MGRPSLGDLEAFAAIAEHSSFSRAADALGVSRSALSHTIRGLEQDLGVRLLNRTTRSVALTDAGAQLLRRLGPLLREFVRALDAVADDGGQPSGRLRINGNESAVRLLLKTVVPQFLVRYPRVDLDLVSEGRLVDIVQQGFDAGVRLAEAVPQDMISIRLGEEFRFLAVAAPGYLAGKTRLVTPHDLYEHQCIRQRLPSGKPYRWEFEKQGQEVVIDAPGALTLDHNALMVEAALGGLGIAFVPEPYAQEGLDTGRLLTVLLDWCPAIPGLRLYYPGHRHVPAALRAFIDLLKNQSV